MAEDWNAVASEVEGALREVGDVSQPNGFPVTLRKVVGYTGGNDYDPESGTPILEYSTFVGIESVQEIRDINGTLTGQTKRTITVNATGGAVPHDDDKVHLGEALTYVDEDTDAGIAWVGIMAVRPLAPAGVAVLYELDLAS